MTELAYASWSVFFDSNIAGYRLCQLAYPGLCGEELSNTNSSVISHSLLRTPISPMNIGLPPNSAQIFSSCGPGCITIPYGPAQRFSTMGFSGRWSRADAEHLYRVFQEQFQSRAS